MAPSPFDAKPKSKKTEGGYVEEEAPPPRVLVQVRKHPSSPTALEVVTLGLEHLRFDETTASLFSSPEMVRSRVKLSF